MQNNSNNTNQTPVIYSASITKESGYFLAEAHAKYRPLAEHVHKMFNLVKSLLTGSGITEEHFLTAQYNVCGQPFYPADSMTIAAQLAALYVNEIETHFKTTYQIAFTPYEVVTPVDEPVLLDGPKAIITNIIRQVGEDFEAAAITNLHRELDTIYQNTKIKIENGKLVFVGIVDRQCIDFSEGLYCLTENCWQPKTLIRAINLFINSETTLTEVQTHQLTGFYVCFMPDMDEYLAESFVTIRLSDDMEIEFDSAEQRQDFIERFKCPIDGSDEEDD